MRPPSTMLATQIAARPRRLGASFSLLLAPVILAGSSFALFWSAPTIQFALFVAIVIAMVLLSVPVSGAVGRWLDAPHLRNAVAAVLLVRIAAAGVRYWIDFSYYGGRADSVVYSDAARPIAAALRRGAFEDPTLGPIVGTKFVGYVTALVFAVVGDSILIGYLVFGSLATVGLLCLVRTAVDFFPTHDVRRYLWAVTLLPSIFLWTSGLGKDALMMFAVGTATLGATRVSRGAVTARNVGILALGLLVGGLTRPHIMVALMCAVAAAQLFGGGWASRRGTRRRRFSIGMLVLAVALAFVARTAFSYLDIGASSSSVETLLAEVGRNTSYGGSAFRPTVGLSPLRLPQSFVNVWLRPFPFEASGVLALASSLEPVALVVLLASVRGRRKRTTGQGSLTPMVIGIVVLGAVAFSGIGNFGLLVRERSTLLAIVLLPMVRLSTVRRIVLEKAPT